ncbi:MAG: DMT family transporter [Motiliproteus sp.]|nr:DMT family transporter [Motiliproteus sp.]
MNRSIKQTMGSREWTMLLLLSLLWGGSFFFVEIAIGDLSPLTIVTFRVAMAALALWGYVWFAGIPVALSMAVVRAFLVMGLLNNVLPFTLIVWGQNYLDSGAAAILNATTPLFTVLVATCLLADERATLMKFVGVLLGFGGVVVLLGFPAESEGGVMPQIAVLVAAFSYALAGVYGRRFKILGVAPAVVAAGQVTASTVFMVPLMLSVDGLPAWSDISVSVWFAIVSLAVLSTALAYVLYFRILETAGATNLLLVTLLIPVSAILLGTLILNETLTAGHFYGMGLIAIGLSFIDGRLWRQWKRGRKVA